MDEVADESVHLVVTSPPYNVGKEYKEHDDRMGMAEYMRFLGDVWKECRRVLKPGGRLCINVANLGRKPYVPLNALITAQLLQAGWLMRGEIIWDKGASAGTRTTWGSFGMNTNPTLRDVHEYIMVFSKDRYDLPDGCVTGISNGDFTSWTKSIWRPEERVHVMAEKAKARIFAAKAEDRDTNWLAEQVARAAQSVWAEAGDGVWVMRTESGSKHPAPFPVELPRRLILLYTKIGDVVLDPFMGSGSTGVAAVEQNRRYIGYDNSAEYCRMAEERIAGSLTFFNQEAVDA